MMPSRPYKYAYPTKPEQAMSEAERLERKRIHDLELAKLKAATPREGKPAGQPPFGLALGQLFGASPSRPYKQKTKDEDKGGERQGQGKLVSQVTPGKLRKEPDIIATLLQQIFDFFKNITNPPKPIQTVMEKYPAPPYTTTEVSPRITTSS
jgi:hypothetical protein